MAIVVYVALLISWFAVIILGRYPEGLFNFLVGFQRWTARVAAYVLLLTDKYPPFSLEDDPRYPVRLQIDYPPRIARWRPLVHWLLAIPALIAAAVLGIVGFFAVIIAWFAILFTGRYPESLFRAVTIALRWNARVNTYYYWMVERYPPFVWA
jgi:hypothetical protein